MNSPRSHCCCLVQCCYFDFKHIRRESREREMSIKIFMWERMSEREKCVIFNDINQPFTSFFFNLIIFVMITLLAAKTTRGWDEIFKINLKFSNICNNEIQFWLQRARRISTTSRLGWTNNKQHVDANGSNIESANINRQYTILSRFSQRAALV